MFKRFLVLALMVSVIAASASSIWAAEGSHANALNKASDQSVFNQVTDWFATVGKSKEERQVILAQRQTKRAEMHAKKQAVHAAKQAGHEVKKTQKAVME